MRGFFSYRGVFGCFCELISVGIIKAENFTRNFFDLVVKSSNLSLPLMRENLLVLYNKKGLIT